LTSPKQVNLVAPTGREHSDAALALILTRLPTRRKRTMHLEVSPSRPGAVQRFPGRFSSRCVQIRTQAAGDGAAGVCESC
jgi:hypothetical protein